MAKKKTNATRSTAVAKGATTTVAKGSPARAAAQPAQGLSRTIRESVEAVAIAFVLALLFRAFVAEAYVIPTGSMAPTLMGAHKDLLCPNCGYRYQTGTSIESDPQALARGIPTESLEVVAVMCPMCRYLASVDPRTAQGRENPSFGGDRILASKFAYELGEPKRWDVFIFKYPNEAQTNYIKRLVGLPNEHVRIWHGDLYIQPEGQADFHIERRSADKTRAMAQIVYDNDYLVDAMTDKGWPLRWQSTSAAPGGAWSTSDRGRSYEVDGTSGDVQWLRYRHFVPTLDDWGLMKDGRLPPDYQPRAQLVTDFYAYNTGLLRAQRDREREQPSLVGQHWVGDLLLDCQLEVLKAEGKARLDLVKGGRHSSCELDCATGDATLSIDGVDGFRPSAKTAVLGKGSHRVEFANIDRQLLLWVDGAAVAFDGPTTYEPLDNDIPQSSPQDLLDLAPAGIGSQASSLRVSQLRLRRDIYYVAAHDNLISDYPRDGIVSSMNYRQLVEFWSTPPMWKPLDRPSPFDQRGEVVFPLGADQFFAMGDNSPQSKDARLWEGDSYVERKLLSGKALYIFWPHSSDKFPGTNLPFPFFPNIARMGFIR